MALPEIEYSREGKMFQRYVYIPGHSPGIPDVMRIGGKAMHLAELQEIGISVPPSFTLTTDAWKDNYKTQLQDRQLPTELQEQLLLALPYLEHKSKTIFGDNTTPLFVSVRSGAPVSMPGAMHTIPNVGITMENVGTLGKKIGDANAQYAYFTLIRSLGKHAFHINDENFYEARNRIVGHDPDTKPSILKYKELVQAAKDIYKSHGFIFPEDPYEQLALAVDSVFRSWDSKEAQEVRDTKRISNNLGTAVTIQEMVWGNSDKPWAGSGIMFTRNIRTGERTPSVLFARGKQGYKVVGDKAEQPEISLLHVPLGYRFELQNIINKLEKRYMRPQEVEFTFDGKRLQTLQTRDLELSSVGELRWAREQIRRSRMTEEAAKKHFSLVQLEQLLVPGLDPLSIREAKKKGKYIGQGVPMSPRWATGQVVYSLEEARSVRFKDSPVIISADLSPSDFRVIQTLRNVVGGISETGTAGSHKARATTRLNAVVMFGVKIDQTKYPPGTVITISGETKEVFEGAIPVSKTRSVLSRNEIKTVKQWTREHIDNPWVFVATENGVNKLTEELTVELKRSRKKYQSRKAHEIELVNSVIPAEIRIPYQVVSKSDVAEVERLMHNALASGSDVTVRTCMYPNKRGKSPYAVITSEEDLRRFFRNKRYTRKYGGWPTWAENPQITEVVVGTIPKNKLNKDYFPFSCNWTLSCVGETLYLQIVPGSPLLRSQEAIKPADMITVEAVADPTTTSGLRLIQYAIGENLQTQRNRYEFFLLVTGKVFGQWWKKYNLGLQMAALTKVFSKGVHTPALEGQAMLLPDGRKWIGVYGAKIDDTEAE